MTTFVRSDVTAQKLGRTVSPVVGTHLAGARERLLALGEKFWDRARDELIKGNQQSLSLAAVQQAIISHVDDAAPEAGVIARTEINRAANAGSILAMRQMLRDVPGSTKTWITSSGIETRESHLAVDGQRVPLHGKFQVGGESLDHPGEGGPANRVNCNCTMLYHFPGVKIPLDAHSAARTVGFYSDDQPRDGHGRFAPGVGGGGDDSGGGADSGGAGGDLIQQIAQARVAQARELEPVLTEKCQEVAGNYDHGHLEGLNFAVKTEGSLERKISGDVAEGKGTPEEVAAKLYDVNRYTVVWSENEYANATSSALDDLRAQGDTLNVKNFWKVPLDQNPYQGINVQGTTKDGARYELQFHTDRSLQVKEGTLHQLYEQQRVSTNPSERAQFSQQMMRASAVIPVPPGVHRVG